MDINKIINAIKLLFYIDSKTKILNNLKLILFIYKYLI